MITEEYVSFETAKLLKNKGFDVNTFIKYANKEGATEKWYDDYRERMVQFNWDCGTLIILPTEPHDKYEIYGDTISAPTLQMAMKWLMEVHKLGIFPSLYMNIIESNIIHAYATSIINLNTYKLMTVDGMARDTYNEACEAAIKYCLENLI